MCEAKNIAKQNGFADYTVNQPCFTYLFTKGGYKLAYEFNVNATEERLRYLAANDIPLVAYSCLAKGGYDDPSRLPDFYETGSRLETLLECTKELGLTPSKLVIAWLLAQDRLPNRPTVIPLFSSSRSDHLKEILEMSDYVLDQEILEKLSDAY